ALAVTFSLLPHSMEGMRASAILEWHFGGYLVCALGMLMGTPIILGARALARFTRYWVALLGASFAVLLGSIYGLAFFPGVLALLEGELCGFFSFAVPGGIGVISVVAGIKTIVALNDPEVRERFASRNRRFPEAPDRGGWRRPAENDDY